MNEQLMKQIPESSYLHQDNTPRYRSIVRFFYEQHERYQDELDFDQIYEHMSQCEELSPYSEDDLHQDLAALLKWKNIVEHYDTGVMQTIRDFHRRRSRYRATPYTIEFERLIIRFEEATDSLRGSLERTLFDRLHHCISELQGQIHASACSDEELHQCFDDVFSYYSRLTAESADFFADLHIEKIEQISEPASFMLFKDRLVEYLGNFVTAMQNNIHRIVPLIHSFGKDDLAVLFDRLTSYQMSIPRIDGKVLEELTRVRYENRWKNLLRWFDGNGAFPSDAEEIQTKAIDIIRKIARHAQRLSERDHFLKNRKNDYLTLAHRFASMHDLEDAHILSAALFGMFHTRHLLTGEKMTDDPFQSPWNYAPKTWTVNPMTHRYREKTQPTPVFVNLLEKRAREAAAYEESERERRLMESLTLDGKIVFAHLTQIEPSVRKTLLSWINRAINHPSKKGRTDDGRVFYLVERDKHLITLRCTDGTLYMPNYEIRFTEDADVR